MTHDKHTADDQALDALLDSLAQSETAPSDALLGRVLGDAYDMQPESAASTPPQADPPVRLVNVLGGWLGMCGLAAAVLVGFWIGFNPPDVFQDVLPEALASDFGASGLEFQGYGWDFEEDAS